ncbi:hypothetical protein KJ909_01215 [Patescibacteria group bacterium]|nr:hypothetical protein [Patescibacteria group bacterium]
MKHQKHDKMNKPFSWRLFLLLGLIISFAIIVVNVISIFLTDADQFNLFYKYDKVYRLETWNIPNNVDVDINGDGVSDRITWTGCLVFAGTLDNDIISKQYDCDKDQTKNMKIFSLGATFLPQVRLSYVGKTNTGNWDIVLIRNLHTDLFNITKQGEAIKKNPPFFLQVDTALYFISHLFVLFTGM